MFVHGVGAEAGVEEGGEDAWMTVRRGCDASARRC